MTNDILKRLAELKHDYECATSAGLSDTPLTLTEALRVAVDGLDSIESMATIYTIHQQQIAREKLAEIAAILGVEVEK